MKLNQASKLLSVPFLCGSMYIYGRKVDKKDMKFNQLPSGLPHSCSYDFDNFISNKSNEPNRHNDDLSSNLQGYSSMAECQSSSRGNKDDKNSFLIDELRGIVGASHIYTPVTSTTAELAKYTVGARMGAGKAVAVVQPGTLKETIEVLRACLAADVVIIPQGRNTGLTGGSVPRDKECSRPTVIINMCRMNKIIALGVGGSDSEMKMLCFAGAGIHDLSITASQYRRESHSILGSVFLNPTVSAGIAFGSGGTQIRKGPVYTERVLWCKVNSSGDIEIVNTLGLESLVQNPLGALDHLLASDIRQMTFAESKLDPQIAMKPPSGSSAEFYRQHVCKFDSHVARYNADTQGIEPCRSEGKVLILASIHDTFPSISSKKTLWISCSSLEEAQQLKREVFMQSPEDLPLSCEYMDRAAFDVVDQAGRVLCHAISHLGIGQHLSQAWGIKLLIEALPLPVFNNLPDQILFWLNKCFPPSLPPKLHLQGLENDHHILVTYGEYGQGNMRRTEERLSKFCQRKEKEGCDIRIFECADANETALVTYFRFAAAPAFRTWCVGKGMQGLSIDYAQAKCDTGAPALDHLVDYQEPVQRMRYAHLGCNVVHEDIAFRPGVNLEEVKTTIKKEIEALGGKLPAEHGHGTEYHAPEEVQERWRAMDPLNVMNPGIGGLSYEREYK